MATTDFVVKNGLVVNEDALIRDTTNSVSTSTGALVVSGGVGIANGLTVGGASTFSNNLTITGDLAVNGGDLTTNQTTFNLVNATATTLNFGGSATTVSIGAATGTTTINNANTVVSGDLAVNGGDLTTNQTTFNLVNATATTLNIGSAASTARLGATTGTLTLGNPTVVGTQVTQNLYNTVATTLNFGGSATTVSIGAATGTTTINNANTVVSGDLAVNGGDLTTNQTTFNLVNATATTLNVGGAATLVDIGAATGTTSINNNLIVDLDVEVRGGDLTTNQTTFNLINTTATTLNVGGAATTISIGSGSGTTTVNNNMVVTGNLTVNGTTTSINSTTLNVDDINIVLGDTAAPTDATANGGGITLRGTTDKTLLWVDATDRWTFNQGVEALSIQNTPIGSTTASSGAFTTLSATGSVTFNTTINNQSYTTTGAGTITITSGTAGNINNMNIGATTRGTGAFTTLDANSTVSLSPANANVAISPTGTGTVTISPAGGLTINPTTAGNINNTNIGATTRGTGAFTTLTANNAVTFTQGTGSVSTGTGTLVVTGGTGISENLFVGGRAVTPRINIQRLGNVNSGISWYDQASFTAWADYMSPAGLANSGPTGNITAPSGTIVTSWALRSFIENVAGYGWTFESGANNTTTPSVVAEIRSSDGAARFGGDVSGNTLTSRATTGTAPLTVASQTVVTNLNADLLDGLDSTQFLRDDVATTWQASNGPLTVVTPAGSLGSNTGQVNTLQVFQATLNTDAFMTFHISGDYAAHFGLDGTTNDLFYGGWSAGAVKHRVWHAGNDGAGSGLDADLLDGLNQTSANTANTIVARNANGDFSAGGINTVRGLSDVSGTASALRLLNPGGASFATTSPTITGALKIKLPVGTLNSSTMMRMSVKIYEYNGATSRTIEIGGYNFSGGSWFNTFATMLTGTAPNLNVRFGQDATTDCIWIGELGTVWNYPQVYITDFLGGFSNYTAELWNDGWALSFVTAFDTVEVGPVSMARAWTSSDTTITAGTLTATSGAGSVSTTTGALIVTGGAGISENLYVGGTLNASNLAYTGTQTSSVSSITGAGTVQGDATAITTDLVIVTSVAAGSGVRLPVANVGKRIVIRNSGLNNLNVYPATSSQINALALNAAFVLSPDTTLEFIGFSTNQWYTINATFA